MVALHRAGERGGILEHPPRRGAGDYAYLIGPYQELPQMLRRAAGS